jgi:FAD/FMN-containing dehydrogenase/Fe-S oxidoreductase
MATSETTPAGEAQAQGPSVDAAAVVTGLQSTGVEIDVSSLTTSAYAYDASNYRIRPVGVVFPRNVDDVMKVLAVCRATQTPIVARGGGTSMAGNAIGPGVVIDFSRFMNRILSVDADSATADVEPGVVLSILAKGVENATSGTLTFAPDPSSQSRATVGGAIGNDACGNHSVRYGRTSEHVVELDIVTADGAQLTVFRGGVRPSDPSDGYASDRARELETAMTDLAARNSEQLRTELGRIPRQVSGYHLSHLLPENGFDIARALVGSEGTCAVVVGARVRLVEKSPNPLLVCLGYPNVVDAARDIESILAFSPAAVEGIDESIVETMRVRRGDDAVLGLPEGSAFLYVDLDGDDAAEVRARADELQATLIRNGRLTDGRIVSDQRERASLWRVREDGAGLSARPAQGGETWGGWEDSAVAPENLADYLSDFQELLDKHDLTGVKYGHFGAGCMHIRVNFELRSPAGRMVFRKFVSEAAELVVKHGGTLSGEHGDGRARSELLPVMYSPALIRAFESFRKLWDPSGLLNPGSITTPDPLDANLALDGIPAREWATHFSFERASAQAAGVDAWTDAVGACIGVGRCRTHSGGVMCPSFRATGDEKDSTRGRARVLQEMVRGARDVEAGWKSQDVRDALDLCLACKACSTDCPVGVDMATYKSEFFSRYYSGRMRPLSHLSLGWLPRWLKATQYASGAVNAILGSPAGAAVARLGGVTPERRLPTFASRRALQAELGPHDRGGPSDVVLFVDSFTKGFRPEVAGAAARVIAETGQHMRCESESCCGLTWISTGQLRTARKLMAKTVKRLDDGSDTPIVVIEPSCAAALKKDAPELLGTQAASRVAARIRSFAGAIPEWIEAGWEPPAMPEHVTVQTHCHEYSTFGSRVQLRALEAMGISDITEATGCCGVAGNFGFEIDHYDISMRVAEQALAPALKRTPLSSAVLSDGFSCSMQIKQLEPERTSLHIAQLADPRNRTAPR